MDNELIIIPEENIFLRFSIEDQLYVVFSKSEDLEIEDKVYFAKLSVTEDGDILRNIESEEEFKKVKAEYERILDTYGEDEQDV